MKNPAKIVPEQSKADAYEIETFKRKYADLCLTEYSALYKDDVKKIENAESIAFGLLDSMRKKYVKTTFMKLKNELIYNEILNAKQEKMKELVKSAVSKFSFQRLTHLEVQVICESVAEAYALCSRGIEFKDHQSISVGLNNLISWSAQESSDEIIAKILDTFDTKELDPRTKEIVRAYQKTKLKEQELEAGSKEEEMGEVDNDEN